MVNSCITWDSHSQTMSPSELDEHCNISQQTTLKSKWMQPLYTKLLAHAILWKVRLYDKIAVVRKFIWILEMFKISLKLIVVQNAVVSFILACWKCNKGSFNYFRNSTTLHIASNNCTHFPRSYFSARSSALKCLFQLDEFIGVLCKIIGQVGN